jgi:alpha-N-arabinofuranosidase
MGHAIVTFDMAGQLLVQQQIEFSCFWNTRWIDNESKPGADHDALDKDGNFNPTGHALKIWGNFLGKQMVKAEATAPVISYSSYNPGENKLFVYLINKSEIPQQVNISIAGYTEKSITQSWEYVGTSSDDINPVWKKRKKSSFAKIQILEGSSITVFEVKVKPHKKIKRLV